MNVVKAKAIAVVVALLAALTVASVGAQSPSAAPTAAITRFTISEKPPEFWAADGGTQASWMAFRQRCADIAAELTRRQGMTYKQFEASPGLSFSRDEWLRCGILSPSAGQAGPALSPSTSSAGISPTPIPTPLPPALPVGPQSLEPDTSDPPATGQSFAGGGASACQSPPAPNVGAQTPPLDVAADVSSTQNVEMRRNPAVDHYLEARSDVAQCRNNLAQTLHFHLLAALPFDFDRNSGVNYR